MLGISLSNRSGLPASALAALSRRAEEHAFSHVVMNESYNDVLAYLVAAASATQRVTLCSGIANVGLRHPVLMALGAAVVDDVSGGRCVLGLGTGTQWFTPDRYDTLAIKPLQMMREYVAVVRAVLSGEPVNLPGPRFPVQDFHLAARPRRAHVPILLAVVGHRMAELAGEIADGVIVNMNGPEDIATIRAQVARGCERAKRDPSSVTVAALVTTCVDDDADPDVPHLRRLQPPRDGPGLRRRGSRGPRARTAWRRRGRGARRARRAGRAHLRLWLGRALPRQGRGLPPGRRRPADRLGPPQRRALAGHLRARHRGVRRGSCRRVTEGREPRRSRAQAAVPAIEGTSGRMAARPRVDRGCGDAECRPTSRLRVSSTMGWARTTNCAWSTPSMRGSGWAELRFRLARPARRCKERWSTSRETHGRRFWQRRSSESSRRPAESRSLSRRSRVRAES
ncbi:MAG: LLM class flavin-dependent oxidoreductase [Chloroflexi bacterium]|nr:LLM class flavin-dependent oxidoreductase [Chloroflexota bacterium]